MEVVNYLDEREGECGLFLGGFGRGVRDEVGIHGGIVLGIEI